MTDVILVVYSFSQHLYKARKTIVNWVISKSIYKDNSYKLTEVTSSLLISGSK